MRLTTYADAAAFLQVAQRVLEAEEAANSLLLGVCLRMRDLPEYVDAPPYLATVHNGADLVLAAMITPPHNLVLAGKRPAHPEAQALIVADLIARAWQPPGVLAPVAAAQSFAEVWQQRTGQNVTLQVRERLFELHTVNHPPYPAGVLRLAVEADLELVAHWLAAFGHEALGEAPDVSEQTRKAAERAIRNGNYYFWDNGGPVSLMGKGRPTAHCISIGPVYTPPELRSRGYASAGVAALSQALLTEGYGSCVLFTDLANPTSNSIYQKIGYRPITDFYLYRFST
jgi:predicted GNAT family acetyltransferase